MVFVHDQAVREYGGIRLRAPAVDVVGRMVALARGSLDEVGFAAG